jgi:hypothetical protein
MKKMNSELFQKFENYKTDNNSKHIKGGRVAPTWWNGSNCDTLTDGTYNNKDHDGCLPDL